jgi:glycosyltransferase involved in cell wall biosynthesis
MTRRDPTLSVVIITYRRADCVRTNLQHLAKQTRPPLQVLIVDGSEDERTAAVTAEFAFATYLRNPRGAGNMTSSRNAALPHVTSDVIAFLDDDAYPEPEYIESLTAFCAAHPDVLLGCARTLNGEPDEENVGVDRLGRMLDDGTILGFFAADPGRDVEIDHGIGATMWMRRTLIDELDGFREFFTGVSGVREDADVFLRAKALGRQAWFVRAAVATHVAAPQAKGRRLDLRYQHWTARNHALLLIANFGMLSRTFARSLFGAIPKNLSYGGAWYRRVVRTSVIVLGYLRGMLVAARLIGRGPLDPIGRFEHR